MILCCTKCGAPSEKANDEITAWTQSLGFQFSTSKTTAVLFHRPRMGNLVYEPSLYFYGSALNVASQIKLLWIVLVHKLNYAPHIN